MHPVAENQDSIMDTTHEILQSIQCTQVHDQYIPAANSQSITAKT